MENTNNIMTSLNVTAQIPLNRKEYCINENTLKDLGTNNNLAYTYHKGLEVTCIEERTKWEWKEVEIGDIKLLTSDFIYPNGLIVDNIDYSNKSYNFVNISIVIPEFNQNNFVRKLIINKNDLDEYYNKQDIINYILSLSTNERTLQPTDSKWNIIIGIEGEEFLIDRIYELENIGKGIITSLTEDNLLLFYDYNNNAFNVDFQKVTDSGYITSNQFYRIFEYGEGTSKLGIFDIQEDFSNSINGIITTDSDFETNYSYLGYDGYNFNAGTLPNVSFKTNNFGTFPNRNLKFEYPLKSNPNYPNYNKYTLATTEDIGSYHYNALISIPPGLAYTYSSTVNTLPDTPSMTYSGGIFNLSLPNLPVGSKVTGQATVNWNLNDGTMRSVNARFNPTSVDFRFYKNDNVLITSGIIDSNIELQIDIVILKP